MRTPVALRALNGIFFAGVLGGVATIVFTFATWPTWDPISVASNMAVILGVDVASIDTSTWTDPEIPGRLAAVAAGALAVLFGLLAGLMALHASALRQSLHQEP